MAGDCVLGRPLETRKRSRPSTSRRGMRQPATIIMFISIAILDAKLGLMPTRETHPPLGLPILAGSNSDFPDRAPLAALCAWQTGVPTRDTVLRYLPDSVLRGIVRASFD